MFFRKLGLIVLKNLFLRGNQWGVTLMEFLMPIFAILIAYSLISGLPSHSSTPEDPKYFDPIDEASLKWHGCDSDILNSNPESKNFITYTPVTPETTRIIMRATLDLCRDEKDKKGNPQKTYIGWIGVDDESEVETKWSTMETFRAAVVFGKNIFSYKIRMRLGLFPHTGKLFPGVSDTGTGPSNADCDLVEVGPNTGRETKYVGSGFIGLQLAVDKALTREATNGKGFTHEISLQAFPYPSFFPPSKYSNKAQTALKFTYMGHAWGLCFMIPSITRNIVGEKETGISELLRLTGVSNTIQWLGWIIHVLTPQFFIVSILTAFMYLPVTSDSQPILDYSDGFMIWIFLLLYVTAAAAFGFFICSLCQKPTIATTVGELLWVLSILVGYLFAFEPNDISPALKITMMSIFPNVAIAEFYNSVLELETTVLDETDQNYGARWLSLRVAVSRYGRTSVPNLHIMLILLGQIVLYMVLAFYFESVLPSEHGVKRPWYLFSCFGSRGRRQATVAAVSELPQESQVQSGLSEEVVAPSSSEVSEEKNEEETKNLVQEPQPIITGFEPEPEGAQVGIYIQGLMKRFGRKVAVNGVSLRMFTGDIFALLGHNGAGKTTLISMLTGFFAPTAGTAYVNGYDISSNLKKARESMGLCPQHNMLFEWLTVSQQLCLFGMLRGLTYKQAKAEANMLLTNMHLFDKSSTLAKKLSGGQKRKLSLGIALIGGTRVVILDEPTSGMDPQARREIWDILLQLRGQRTILLTTHFMEEADVLGDRIGIMANGMLQCCGTTAFLKKYYGTGYTLKLTLYGAAVVASDIPPSEVVATPEGSADIVPLPAVKLNPAAEAILVAVQQNIPDASFKANARVDHANNEVFFTLPSETATTAALSQMFSMLTARKEKLGINTIGLSQTTMDEVFVRVGALADEEKYGAPMDHSEPETFQRAPKQLKNKFLGQFTALLIKKFIYSIRKWVVLIFETLIPMALFLTVVHITNVLATPYFPGGLQGPNGRSVNHRRGHGRSANLRAGYGRSQSGEKTRPTDYSMPMTLDKYDSPVTFYTDKGNPKVLHEIIGKSAEHSKSISSDLLKVGARDIVSYKRNYIIAAEMTSTEFTAMFNIFPYHAVPLAMNIATNSLLKHLDPNGNHRIKVENHPFYEEVRDENDFYEKGECREYFSKLFSGRMQARQGPSTQNNQNGSNQIKKSLADFVGNLVSLGLLFLTANFIVAPIEERLCNAKQLQMMTGVSPLVYWGAAFTYDFFFYSTVVFVMMVYLLIFEYGLGYGILSENEGWLVFVLIAEVYGFSSIFFTYFISLRPNSVTGGFFLITMIHILAGPLMGLTLPDPNNFIYFSDGNDIMVFIIDVLKFFSRLCPTYSLVRAMWYYGSVSQEYNNCYVVNIDPSKCPAASYGVWEWDETKQVTITKYIRTPFSGPVPKTEVFDVSVPRIGQELFFIVLMGLVYIFRLLMSEYKIWSKLRAKLCKDKPFAFPPNINDEDVYLEMERVNMLLATGQVATECLVVQNICKRFESFAAVSQLHFGVHYGECFGLLGVNGAGKTTLFRIITGDETASLGEIYGFGTSLDKQPAKFFSNIGYCPQFDAILTKFTGKEMLELFAGLRGVPYRFRKNEAMLWLHRMGLQESANAKCGRYSGGMKRRLSTAMAMIGDPALVLLDEPTSGVDPVSRRQFWKILDKLKESGQSIILTSHSMEECEALCSRLGIMVNGQFQCFGGVQHLKNKFAQGYSLTLKLKPNLPFGDPQFEEHLQLFQKRISERFQPCILKDKHQNLFQYHLQNPSMTWDVLFKTMEEIKAEYGHLMEDYSVNETSLEEIFLSFARMQYPERKANVSLCKQVCTCRC